MKCAGILVLSSLKQFTEALHLVEKFVSDLYVHLAVPVSSAKLPISAWSRVISQLYLESQNQQSAVLNMRVLIGTLKEQNLNQLNLASVKYIFSDYSLSDMCEKIRSQLNIDQETIFLQQPATCFLEELEHVINEKAEGRSYNTVVLGGTFDRLHLGHKIFLSEAVIRAKKRLVVGVTVNSMNKSKILPELILPVEQRINDVKKFLTEIDTTLHYEVVSIEDAFGPTKSDADMDLLVVSTETKRGGEKVNQVRAENQLSLLDIHVVDLLPDHTLSSGPRETKVSSSNQRLDLLGTRLRTPEPRTNLSKQPYIIGLTGGIGSGKSQMAARFEKRGATIFNCDLIAHSTYEPGQSVYLKIVQHFGKQILDDQARIDRKKLGAIVFSNKDELEVLNSIVWPEVMKEVKNRIEKAFSGKSIQVAIIEAALLYNAGWDKECHEVWAMLVPPQEALARIMRRNNLSQSEAQKRIDNQPKNDEFVAKAHVVFSSQWDAEFTEKQADRAWQMLMTELKLGSME